MRTFEFVHDEVVDTVVITSTVVAWIPTEEILEELNPILKGWGFTEDQLPTELPNEQYSRIMGPTVKFADRNHHYDIWRNGSGHIRVSFIKERHIRIIES